MVFAELGAMYTASGAQYQVLRDAYGPFPAFLFVFCNATAIQAGSIGVIAVICADNLAVAAGRSLEPAARFAVAAALVGALTAANIAGVRWGARIQNATVFAKVLTLLAVAALAAALGRHGVLESIPPAPAGAADAPARLDPLAALLASLPPVLFALGGWQQILWAGGEVRDPRRTIPRAVVGGVVLVVIVYMLANWSYLRLLGIDAMASSRTLAADAVAAAFGAAGGDGGSEPARAALLAPRLVAGAVALSAFGVLNAQFLTGPRLIYGMAADGRFFRPCARIHPRTGTPVAAILVLPAIALVMLALAGRDGPGWLVNWSVALDAVFFVMTGLALIVLRRKNARARPPGSPPGERAHLVRAPFYPLVPLVFALGELATVVGAALDPEVQSAALVGLAWIAGAAVLYAVRFRRAS